MSTRTASEAPEVVAPDRPPARGALVLAIVVVCQLMLVLDATVVNVALTPIRNDLGFSATGLSWVVNAYALAFGGLLLLGGRLGDVLGRRRVFIAGVALFTISSLVGGVAPSEAILVAARATQGLGAAVAAPSALAILLATFPEGAPRNKALGLYSAMSAAGGAIGLLLGGALTSWLSWRWVLLINVPVGAAIVALTARLVASSVRIPGRFDVAGALVSTGGMTMLVYGFIRAGAQGWGDDLAVVAFVLAVVLLASFVAIEQRVEQPLLPLRLFERSATASAYFAMLLVPAVLLGMYFFITQYLQVVLGYSAIETGLAFLPMAILIFAGSQAVPRYLQRIGPRPFMIAGGAALTAGTLWLTQLSASSGYLTAVGGPVVLFGLGGGLLFMPLSAVLLSGVRLEDSGAASGAMQTAQQLGAALGVAVLVSVFAGAGDGEAGPAAFADGVADAFVAAAAFALLILVVITLAVRPRPPAEASAP
ncbi:MFS transporter [Thermoleophilia bacterium SCSIO 60948]|nr:MFS transporter [Thermoleophilia bacterium SCSIO 60948]